MALGIDPNRALLAAQLGLGNGGGIPQVPLALGPGTPGGMLTPFASASGQGTANAIGGATSAAENAAASGGASGWKAAIEKAIKGGPTESAGTKKLAEDAAAKTKWWGTGGLGIGGLFGPVEGASGMSAVGQGLAGRVAIPLAGAYGASALGHALTLGQHNGSWDEGAEGALTGLTGGALAGATIGAPFFGIGAVPGALIGGAIGGLGGLGLGLFGPKNTGEKAVASETAKGTRKLNSLLDQFGASDAMKQQLAAQFQMGAAQAGSKSEVRNMLKQITTDPSLAASIAQDKRRNASLAAVQAWMGPAMEKALNTQQFYANAQGDALSRIAQQYSDPGQRATTEAYAANARSSAASRAAAMMQQLALAPALYGYATPQNSDGTQQTDLAALMAAQPTS